VTPVRPTAIPALEAAGEGAALALPDGGAGIPSALEQHLSKGRLRATLAMLGPAFVASVAYVDPGNFADHPATERASFFAADGSLRMVDARSAEVTRPFAPGEWQSYVVEDYRYDALGRRVWVRSRKWCDSHGKEWPAATECKVGTLRRTIWDGDKELAEIQMPWAIQLTTGTADTTQYPSLWENDTSPVSLPTMTIFSDVGDPNPYFGHVIYAGRRDIDEPIAITRVNYVMGLDWNRRNTYYTPPRVKAPFTIVPFWNARGDAPVGVFTNGDQFLCGTPHIGPGTDTGCVAIRWPYNWSSADRNGGLPHDYWHGTLLDGKRDASGFRYMRNRFYDPLTGRFTQEDPLGLAGGLNLYGFANGDPVNFADPFGLMAGPCDGPFLGVTAQQLSACMRQRTGNGALQRIVDIWFAAMTFVLPGATEGSFAVKGLGLAGAGRLGGAMVESGKLSYLLGKVAGNAASAGKGGFFEGVLGFTEESLLKAVKNHLTENLAEATVNSKGFLEVTGEMVGANGRRAMVKTVWERVEDSYRLITAVPN